jgi:hypothetical protein
MPLIWSWSVGDAYASGQVCVIIISSYLLPHHADCTRRNKSVASIGIIVCMA